jgi:hypothetical protein
MSVDRTVQENEWREKLQDQTDPELIESFNREVGNSGSGYARSLYSRCLIDEISNRKRDFSVISEDGYCISYANKVILIWNKLVIDENQTKVPDTTNVRGIIYDPSEEDDAGLKRKRDGYRTQEQRQKGEENSPDFKS